MSTSKKRQPSAPRGSHYSEGKLVDDKTNQSLFFRTHLCTVFRETVENHAPFNTAEAIKVMENNLKKRQAHCKASILHDRFTIEKSKNTGKTPFRSWVFYKEIVDIQPSKTKPLYFVLLVNAINSGRRYYEVYKCKNREDAAKFTGFIEKARNNPEFVISDRPPLDVVPVPNPDHVRSMANIEFQVSIDSSDEGGRPQSMFQTTSPTPPSGFDGEDEYAHDINDNLIEEVNENVVESVPLQEVEMPAFSAPPCSPTVSSPPMTNGITDLEGVMYINYNSKREAYACTNGPVYLYAAREKNMYSSENNNGSINNYYSPE